MQECFRAHPDIYGAELEDDDANPPDESAQSPSPAPADASLPTAATSATSDSQAPPPEPSASGAGTSGTERAKAAKRQVERDHGESTGEGDGLVPKAAHDATGGGSVK